MNFLYSVIILFSCVYGKELSASENSDESIPAETVQEQINVENMTTPSTVKDSSKNLSVNKSDEISKSAAASTPVQPGNELLVPLESHVPQFSEITVSASSEENKPSSVVKASSLTKISADKTSNKQVKDEIEKLEQPQMPIEVEETEAYDVKTLEDQEHDAQVGIDTSSLEEPQGSWLLKRMWWNRAQEAYQKIKNLIDAIMDKRVDFFTKRVNLGKELFDVFYLEIGMGLGEFTALIRELTEELEKEWPAGEISEEKQKILDNLTLEKTSIDQVKKHIEMLKEIDHGIEQSLSTVIEIINSVRKYEHDAWQYFKEIGEILSDKKARELFYKIDVALQNVKQMNKYLDQEFAVYFENLETRARTSVEQIRKDLQNFKDKGIDLKTSIANLQKQEEVKIIEEQHEEEEITPKKPVSWWQSIINTIKSYF